MENKSPHFWWIISIFSITILGLIAFILTERIVCAEKIMIYISYASVILSITLSVFAILYTYTSNVQIQQQFNKINAAAENIQSVSNELTATEKKLNDSLEIILEKLENINQSQQKIYNQFNNENAQINGVNITNQ